jgi:hypothetical protein
MPLAENYVIIIFVFPGSEFLSVNRGTVSPDESKTAVLSKKMLNN